MTLFSRGQKWTGERAGVRRWARGCVRVSVRVNRGARKWACRWAHESTRGYTRSCPWWSCDLVCWLCAFGTSLASWLPMSVWRGTQGAAPQSKTVGTLSLSHLVACAVFNKTSILSCASKLLKITFEKMYNLRAVQRLDHVWKCTGHLKKDKSLKLTWRGYSCHFICTYLKTYQKPKLKFKKTNANTASGR